MEKVILQTIKENKRQDRVHNLSQFDSARLSDKLNLSTIPGTQHPALLYSPRMSSQSNAQPSFDKRKSQQMERFLKSSIPQSRRGMSIIGQIYENQMDELNANHGNVLHTSQGGRNHKRLSQLMGKN